MGGVGVAESLLGDTISADRRGGRPVSPVGRTAGRRGSSAGAAVRGRSLVTGENFSVRSVLGVAFGPTPDAVAPDGVEAAGEVGAPKPLSGADVASGSEGDDEVAADVRRGAEGDDDDDDGDVYARAVVGSGRTAVSGARRRGSTRSDGTDGIDPAPSSPAGASPPTAKRSSGSVTPSAPSCSRSAAISCRRARRESVVSVRTVSRSSFSTTSSCSRRAEISRSSWSS